MKKRKQAGLAMTEKELQKEAKRLDEKTKKEFGMTKEKAEQFVAEFWHIIEECVLEEEKILKELEEVEEKLKRVRRTKDFYKSSLCRMWTDWLDPNLQISDMPKKQLPPGKVINPWEMVDRPLNPLGVKREK
jgi:hypothetical protein